MSAKKAVLIGVPLDWGASKRGAAGGPDAIRRTDLQKSLESLGLEVEDAGDVAVPKSGKVGNPKLKYAGLIGKVCEDLAKKTYGAVKAGAVPVTLGGDHSLAMGSVSGVARYAREEKKRSIGLIWVDAHGDINTPETSPSGNVHGMPMAHLLGMGDKSLNRMAGFSPALEARRTCLIGVRDLDDSEKGNLRKSGVNVFTMADIDRQGMAAVIERAIELSGGDSAGIHVSFDVDAADPSIAQGVGTPKRGGLSYREVHLLMEMIAESGKMISLDMAEVNPLEDSHNQTAELASELILSALGKRIY